MNFKKIALVLALASSFAAQAEVTPFDLTNKVNTTEAGAVVAALPIVVPFLNEAPTANTAFVIQQGTADTDVASMAYVDQSGDAAANYAAVLQQGVGALAYVKQVTVAASNTAILYSNDSTGSTVRDAGLVKDTDVDALAEAEILAQTLSAGANAQLVDQTDAGGKNVAYIYSLGTNNFAAITQNAGAGDNMALISQLGNGNRAYIKQASTAASN